MQQNRPVLVPVRTGAASARLATSVLAAAFVVSGAAAPALAQDAGPAAASPAVAEAATLFDLWAGEQLDYHGVPGVVVGGVSDRTTRIRPTSPKLTPWGGRATMMIWPSGTSSTNDGFRLFIHSASTTVCFTIS